MHHLKYILLSALLLTSLTSVSAEIEKDSVTAHILEVVMHNPQFKIPSIKIAGYKQSHDQETIFTIVTVLDLRFFDESLEDYQKTLTDNEKNTLPYQLLTAIAETAHARNQLRVKLDGHTRGTLVNHYQYACLTHVTEKEVKSFLPKLHEPPAPVPQDNLEGYCNALSRDT